MIALYRSCLDRLASADMEFIASTLARSEGEREALWMLITDHKVLDTLLDDPKLLRALGDLIPSALGISSALYFTIVLRTAARSEPIEPGLLDYCASLLADLAENSGNGKNFTPTQTPVHYLVDLLAELEGKPAAAQFAQRLFIGNYSLLLSGVFPEFLKDRAHRHAAPGFSWYEEMGAAQFQAAATALGPTEWGSASMLQGLAMAFHELRLFLNRTFKGYCHLGSERSVERLLGSMNLSA